MQKKHAYTTRKQLIKINQSLSDDERNVLEFLGVAKMAMNDQMRRLFLRDAKNEQSGRREMRRLTARLKTLGLVDHYVHQINDLPGMAGYVWHLTEVGYRLLRLGEKDMRRVRSWEPNTRKMRHTVAVVEAYVQIVELTYECPALELLQVEFEPRCWRCFNGYSLRPDLYVVLRNGRFTDRYFFEVDLGTEETMVVVAKCCRYVDYFKQGAEQAATGAFPLVVWVVPKELRKENILVGLRGVEYGDRIFAVITPGELRGLILE